MSAGSFIDTAYETDAGELFPCRVQPETLAATFAGTANAAPSGSIPPGRPSVRLRQGKRSFGIIARTVTVKLPPNGTPPTGYTGANLVIPILDATLFASIGRNDVVVYLGATWRVASKSSEDIR